MSGSGFSSTFRRQPGTPRSAAWHFQQRRQRRDRRLGHVGHPLRVQQIADRDHLYQGFQQLKQEGGQAAGIDGLHATDLSPSEVGNYMGVLSATLLNGTYRPQKVRRVPIPKPGTTEHRILKIGVIGDRVVGKALHNAFTPFWEKYFLSCSYGFRPKQSAWRLLADLEVRMQKLNRWVLAIADVRKAFDNVPVNDVIALHHKALEGIKQKNFNNADKARTVALINKVLRGHDDKKSRGIDQGGPYSPTALNVLLHYQLDVPLTECIGTKPLWHRYADNLVYLAISVSEGQAFLGKVSQLLQPLGMTLKEDAKVVDLSTGEAAHLLGFTLRQERDQIHYGIGSATWDYLIHYLSGAHVEPNPPLTAQEVVLGWVNALGPAFEDGDAAEVLTIAAQYGFREISLKEIRQRWKESWIRWQKCRQYAQCRQQRQR